MGAINTRLVPCLDVSISQSSEDRYNPVSRRAYAHDSCAVSAPANPASIPRAPVAGRTPPAPPLLPQPSAAASRYGVSPPKQPTPLQVPIPRRPPATSRPDSPETAGTPPGVPPPMPEIASRSLSGGSGAAAVVGSEGFKSLSGGAAEPFPPLDRRSSFETRNRTSSAPQPDGGDIPTALAEPTAPDGGMGKRVTSMDVPVATPLLISEPPCTGEMVKPLKSALKRSAGKEVAPQSLFAQHNDECSTCLATFFF